MRNAIRAACFCSTALLGAPAAWAQTQPQITSETAPSGEVRARAAIAECDRLGTLLEQPRPSDPGVTPEQVREWRLSANAEACRENLERLTAAPPTRIEPGRTPQSGSPGQATAAGTAPAAASASAAAPAAPPPAAQAGNAEPPQPAASLEGGARVLVQQAQPSVTVRQAQPEIIVRQAPPIITVQQPQPEIIVRMPEPDVNVATARPQVQVLIPQPQVQVVPPDQQAGADVKIERQQPTVRFERTGEPQIVYQPAPGEPTIRFEPMGAQSTASAAAPGDPAATTGDTSPPGVTQQNAQAQLNRGPGYGTAPVQGAPEDTTRPVAAIPPSPAAPQEPQQTGAVPVPTQPVAVERLEDMALYNAREEKLGDVDAVLRGPGDRTFLVVTHGGFLGLGERRVAMPLDRIALRGDRLVAQELTDEQIRSMPDFDDRSDGYTALDGNATAPVRVAQ